MARPEPGAAVFLDDAPDPRPTPGWVRIRVANTAICGTDRHIFHWDPSIAASTKPPVVIGHEFCGYIDEIGDGVEDWQIGDYVSAEMHIVCRQCRACRARNFHVCENTLIAGLGRDGSFAEHVVVPATNLVRLDPAFVPPHIGAFLDALGNAVHTVESASQIQGRHVLVSGYGAIGAMASAIVEFQGAASLTITEISEHHLQRAKDWVAERANGETPIHIHNPLEQSAADLAAKIREQTHGGVDAVLEMSGAPAAINSGLELLYPGGELILLGLPSSRDLLLENFSDSVIFKGLTLRGIIGRRMFETWDTMLKLLKNGLDVEHIVTHRLPLHAFHDGIRLLDEGHAHKVVLDPAAG